MTRCPLVEAATHNTPQIGPYRLEVQIGGTGSTEVWAARRGDQGSLPVAVKLVRDEDHNPSTVFQEEARAAQSLAHPGLVPIFELGDSDRGFYVAMELVKGPSLARLLERLAGSGGRLSPALVAYVGVRISEALGYAVSHASLDGLAIKLVHRHLSPNNVLIDAGGHVRLSDLGVAASGQAVADQGRSLRGRLEYLAPEQIREDKADERSDLFALGAILYQCASGRPPFTGGTPEQVMSAVLDREISSLAVLDPAFPAALSAVIARAMSKNPASRYQSATEMRHALLEAAKNVDGYHEAAGSLARLVDTSFPEGFYGAPPRAVSEPKRVAPRAASSGVARETVASQASTEVVPTLALDAKPPQPTVAKPITDPHLRARIPSSQTGARSVRPGSGSSVSVTAASSSSRPESGSSVSVTAASSASRPGSGSSISVAAAPSSSRLGPASAPVPSPAVAVSPPAAGAPRVEPAPPPAMTFDDPAPISVAPKLTFHDPSPSTRPSLTELASRESEPPSAELRALAGAAGVSGISGMPLPPPPPLPEPRPLLQGDEAAHSALPRGASAPPRADSRGAVMVPVIAPHLEPDRVSVLEWASDVAEDPERRKTAIIFISALVLLAILWGMIAGPSRRHDDALRAAYEEQRYEDAERYFLAHLDDFKYPESAFDLAVNARLRRLGVPLDAIAAQDTIAAGEDEGAAEPAEAPAVPSEAASPEPPPSEAAPAEGAAADEAPAEEAAPPAANPPAAAPKPRPEIVVPSGVPIPDARSKADKKARAEARRAEDAGVRALAGGDLDGAHAAFMRCLSAREHPSCHLRAALVLEKKGVPGEAARHFERYLMLYPEAPQSDEIRERIAIARGQR